MSEIKQTRDWFAETQQIPHGAEPNVQQTGFYIGMQCEELAEKLRAVLGPNHTTVVELVATGELFKQQAYIAELAAAFADPDMAEELLDGDADLLWVTIGSAAAQGSDLHGAYNHGVALANWGKKFPDGTFHRHPTTGKVLKPEGWKAADLTPFLHPSQR